MNLRRDTLAAAAQATLAIRESGIARGGVATVGNLASTPGVITAVAGRTEMQLDQRHLDRDALGGHARRRAHRLPHGSRRLSDARSRSSVYSAPHPLRFTQPWSQPHAEAVADAGGGDGDSIPSGPLHDATEIGRLVPTAMIFAQSDPPLSHAKIENSTDEALRVAIEAYGRTVAWALSNPDALRGGDSQ